MLSKLTVQLARFCTVLYCTILTVQLARFTRAHMFGPGTACRCATCVRLPDTCQWGGGPYAGTLLLYAQEMALNVLWSDREYEVELQTINRRAMLSQSRRRPLLGPFPG